MSGVATSVQNVQNVSDKSCRHFTITSQVVDNQRLLAAAQAAVEE